MFGRFRRVRVSPAECGIVRALDGALFHRKGHQGPQRMHEGCARASSDIHFIVSAPTDNDFVHSSWSLVSFVLKNAPHISTGRSGPHSARPGWEKCPDIASGAAFNAETQSRCTLVRSAWPAGGCRYSWPEWKSGTAAPDVQRPSLRRHACADSPALRPVAPQSVQPTLRLGGSIHQNSHTPVGSVHGRGGIWEPVRV